MLYLLACIPFGLASCRRDLDSLEAELAKVNGKDPSAVASLSEQATAVISGRCAAAGQRSRERLTAFASSLAALNEGLKQVKAQQKVRRGARALSSDTKATLMMSVGSLGEQAELQLQLPVRARAISSPHQLMSHVSHAWDVLVAPHQAGLTDAKAHADEVVPLSPQEAWHHYEASKRGVIDSARLLVTFSIVPSLQSGSTALHAAAARGDVRQLRAILDDEATLTDVDLTAPDGTTALHAAASMGHADAVGFLISQGAGTEATGQDGATALMRAAAMGHLSAVTALLDGGASADTAHPFALSTALHFAAEMGHADIVSTLCAAGADADAAKSTGGTPLHTAADCDQPRAIRALLAPPCAASPSVLLNKDTRWHEWDSNPPALSPANLSRPPMQSTPR